MGEHAFSESAGTLSASAQTMTLGVHNLASGPFT